jgi:hypothetical protein
MLRWGRSNPPLEANARFKPGCTGLPDGFGVQSTIVHKVALAGIPAKSAIPENYFPDFP